MDKILNTIHLTNSYKLYEVHLINNFPNNMIYLVKHPLKSTC